FGCDDGDGGVIVEFQLAGADYPLAGSQSLFNHHQAVATFARGNETTLDTLAWLALFVGLYLAGLILLIRDDIERVAVKAISDGGFRYHHALRRLGQQDIQIGKHAWQKFFFGVLQLGAQLDIARAFLGARVDGADLPGEHLIGIGRYAELNLLADAQLRHALFRQEEI